MTTYNGIEKIDIKTSCDVAFKRCIRNIVSVYVDGTKKNDVKIHKSGSILSIEYVSANGGGTSFFSSGDVVMGNVHLGNVTQINSGGQNISIVNGVVYINGKQVKPEGSTEPDIIPVRIVVELPDGLNLESEFTGMAEVTGDAVFNSVRINSKGAVNVGLRAKTARASVSGSGDLILEVNGGALRLNLDGSADVRSSGSYSDIDVIVSGSADVQTVGHVSGDYDAQVSGSGLIWHTGTIVGSKNKSVSGSGRIVF